MVQQEASPFCRACEEFHEESTCPVLCLINEKGFLETTMWDIQDAQIL